MMCQDVQRCRVKHAQAASSYGGSNGYVATVSTLSASAEAAALKHFTAYELPNYQAQYPDLDKSDLERLIGFKWSKLEAREKAAWASNEKRATAEQRSAPVAPAVTKQHEAGYAAFLKAELPAMQASSESLKPACVVGVICHKTAVHLIAEVQCVMCAGSVPRPGQV
jgi:hypothetical protein